MTWWVHPWGDGYVLLECYPEHLEKKKWFVPVKAVRSDITAQALMLALLRLQRRQVKWMQQFS